MCAGGGQRRLSSVLSGPVPVVIDGTGLELGRIIGSNSPRSESCPSFDYTPEVRQGSRV